MQTHPKQPRTHAAPPSLIANRSDGLIPLSAPKRGRRYDTALARHSVDAPLPRPRFDSPFAPTSLCPDRPLPRPPFAPDHPFPPQQERGVRQSSRTLTLVLKAQNPNDFNSGAYLHPWGGERYASLDEGERLPGSAATQEAERLLTSVQQSLSFGIAPQLSWDGTGGTYVLRDARRIPIAAFKPRDEEPFAPNNPRGLPGKMGQVFLKTAPLLPYVETPCLPYVRD